MKKSVCVLLALCLLIAVVVPLAVFTASADTDGNWTYSVSNGEARITKYNGTETDVVIPSTLGGYPVTAISNASSSSYGAFNNKTSITSITIPDGVTTIGNYAFYYCSNLTSIAFPDSVTSIGNYAFHDCSSLSSIVIPDSVTSIGQGSFGWCTSLTSVMIPDSVTNIKKQAFYRCSSLEKVLIYGSPNLETNVFAYYQNDWLPLPLTLYGYASSSVESYANNNGLMFEAFNFGDIDGNGYINLSDVTALAKNLTGWDTNTRYHAENADCDDDGMIGLGDVTHLAKYVAGWSVTLGHKYMIQA